jgi:predicted transcriptional regulator
MTVSLPPAMREEFEAVRRAENRTSSELVREALRQYFYSRFPVRDVSREELAAIRRGRAQIRRGEYVTLEELRDGLAGSNRKTRAKGNRKTAG